ncbi:MAG: protein phosphatase 2C domain-containing protein [Dysgonamonadaceae bacterium]|jgi:serine/threonine protein phosphatase PrpC|nr:protein phosphatase 2C domain-containing protein [Dysgonamonadaceae bacterium]
MQKTEIFGQMDMGRVRTNNEDNFVSQYIWDKNHVLGVAIDGVGGYEGGEVAAEIAKNTIVEYLEKYPNGERLVLLSQAVTEANNRIFDERGKQPKCAQMSCVLSAVLVEVEEKRINMVHIGDSRIYQFGGGVLEKLSHDHSSVGYREDIGVITEKEAMNHPKRNEINRMLGDQKHQTDDHNFLEVNTFSLRPNSILLLCSDGLTDLVTRAEMTEILSLDIPLETKTQKLINRANNKGGRDNITVVLISIQDDELSVQDGENIDNVIKTAAPPKKPIVNRYFDPVQSKKYKTETMILVAIIALLLGLCVGGWVGKTYLSDKKPSPFPKDSTAIADDSLQKDSLSDSIKEPSVSPKIDPKKSSSDKTIDNSKGNTNASLNDNPNANSKDDAKENSKGNAKESSTNNANTSSKDDPIDSSTKETNENLENDAETQQPKITNSTKKEELQEAERDLVRLKRTLVDDPLYENPQKREKREKEIKELEDKISNLKKG